MDRAPRLAPLFPVWMLLSLLASGPLQAAEGRWEPVGPIGADVTALAVAPSASPGPKGREASPTRRGRQASPFGVSAPPPRM